MHTDVQLMPPKGREQGTKSTDLIKWPHFNWLKRSTEVLKPSTRNKGYLLDDSDPLDLSVFQVKFSTWRKICYPYHPNCVSTVPWSQWVWVRTKVLGN